jgi:BirA family transcriptional regulator, biotin operon repressor / biotin---[acetyl-CoA-carboxylase] ligase
MRELILETLRQEKHISGQEIGKRLRISRTAVWKNVNELRKIGYQIESSPKIGYTFIKSTNLLLSEEIKFGLDTQIMGKKVVHYNTVSSTQDIAGEMARCGAEEGTLVIAEMQEKGRGRKGRNWVSLSESGIYFSLILRPNLLPSQVTQIPLVAGIALTRAIRKIVPLRTTIKWPNDILIGKKKVGGILTEMSSEIDRINFIVLGIGLNVNMPASLLRGVPNGTATSLIEECGEHTSRAKLVQSFLREFELTYNKYLNSGFSSLKDEWKTLNNTIGARVKVSGGEKEIEGMVIDINDNGFLLIKKDDSEVGMIVTGDVSFCGRLP